MKDDKIKSKRIVKSKDRPVKKPVREKTGVVSVESKKGEKTATAFKQTLTTEFTRALGRRKTASSRVRLYAGGSGKIEVNSKDYKSYFPFLELQEKLVLPLKVVGKRNSFDWTLKVEGGGNFGQAEACALGIARALVKFNEEYKPVLRASGLLTRDPREKERKKFGLKRARRAPQWSKR